MDFFVNGRWRRGTCPVIAWDDPVPPGVMEAAERLFCLGCALGAPPREAVLGDPCSTRFLASLWQALRAETTTRQPRVSGPDISSSIGEKGEQSAPT